MIKEEWEHIAKSTLLGVVILSVVVFICKVLWLNGLIESLLALFFGALTVLFILLVSYLVGAAVLTFFEKEENDDINPWDPE